MIWLMGGVVYFKKIDDVVVYKYTVWKVKKVKKVKVIKLRQNIK